MPNPTSRGERPDGFPVPPAGPPRRFGSGPLDPRGRNALAIMAAVIAVLTLASVLGARGPAPVSSHAPGTATASASAGAILEPSSSPGASTTDGNAGSPPPSAPPTDPAPSVVPGGSPTPSPTADPEGVPAAALQARLDRIRERLAIPGVSVAIVWDDGRTWVGASGLRDVKAGDPMTTDTAFALASVSKTATAAVVLQLVDEGVLSLDQRVAPLLPAFDLHPRITVRQLLDHTSGLPDYFLNVAIDRPLQAEKDAAWTAKRTWTYVPPALKRPRPGRTWMYSNTNYLLLGELVEAVTGRPLATEIRRRLLEPLGLEHTWYQVEEEPRAEGTLAYRLVSRADGTVRAAPVARRSEVMPFRSVVTAAGGAGSIAATALDAARWMQAFGRGDVVSEELYLEMIGDVAATARLGARTPYGLGIQALPLAGRVALGHSGRFLGFRNVVRYLPGEGVSIAVLTNQGVKDPTKIAEGLLRELLPPLPKPSPSPSGSASPSPSGS